VTETLTLSALGHTWLLDLDGTLVTHNGYKSRGGDEILEGAEEFLRNIPEEDMLIFITSREAEYREITENFLAENNIRYNKIIFSAPFGERILINDCKPSGLKTAIAVNTERNKFSNLKIEISEEL
jgi:ribonucleotide monophosphatase NagD (HAD superfamily)